MAIRKSTAFTASDGSLCATLEEAQRHELALLVVNQAKLVDDAVRQQAVEFSHFVQANSEAVLDILTTGPRSRPAARKSKGTNNPRRAARAATPEQARKGFAAARAAVDSSPDADPALTLAGEVLSNQH